MGTGIFSYALLMTDPKSSKFESLSGVALGPDPDTVRGFVIASAMEQRPSCHLIGQSVQEVGVEVLTRAGYREVLPPDPERIQRIAGQLREHGGVDSPDLEWLVEQAVQVREEKPAPESEERQQFYDLMDRVARLQKAMTRIANLRYSEADDPLEDALTIADKALESDGTGAEVTNETIKFEDFGLDTLVRLLWLRDNPKYLSSSFDQLVDPAQLDSYRREIRGMLSRAGIGGP